MREDPQYNKFNIIYYIFFTFLFRSTGLKPSEDFNTNLKCKYLILHSLATTNRVSVDVLSSGYLDVSVRRVRFPNL